uniref:Uncharacterized protein n=1 Tax=Lepeophtheirus salmonis TaxID=72036 RepID=A0A0K2TYY0_LEPSM
MIIVCCYTSINNRVVDLFLMPLIRSNIGGHQYIISLCTKSLRWT